ncbi:MAG: hypothetical protein IIA66_14735, partial [Planctomycetes bacterium]|nr:hypothetical protein [Planctomycetota bacterium]
AATAHSSRYFAEWDDKLFTLDNDGQLSYTFDEGVTWENNAKSDLPAGSFNGLWVGRNADDRFVINMATSVGAFALDFDRAVWVRTEMTWPQHEFGGQGAIAFEDASYVPTGLRLQKHRPGDPEVKNVGLDRDDASCVICGVMEHIEEAGIHSGDSACALPPYSLSQAIVDEIRRQARLLAQRLNVCGLMNIQFAIKGRRVYVLEANPRASRTVPFVSKATGVPWAKVAMSVMLGTPLKDVLRDHDFDPDKPLGHVSVKEAVFPFDKFPGVDVVMGPEMRSTGEVMGIDRTFARAFAKAQMAAGQSLPTEGTIYISVNDGDKPFILPIARALQEIGFDSGATAGTRDRLASAGITCELGERISQNPEHNAISLIEAGRVSLLINTATRTGRYTDEGKIRAASVRHRIPLITTLTEAQAAVQAIRAMREGTLSVAALQDYFVTAPGGGE